MSGTIMQLWRLSVLELAEAVRSGRCPASGGGLPLLHGVPFTIKVGIDLVGTPANKD